MGVTIMIADEIKIGGFGAYLITENQSNGYDIIKWGSTPFTVQNNHKDRRLKQNELLINTSILATAEKRKN